MKKILLTGFVITFMILQMYAQTPEAIKYQAVARDNGGNIIALQVVRFRLSIHQGSDTGPVVYSEWQLKLTNAFGLANLDLGTGNIIYGDFSVIDWGSSTYFLRTEIDPTGGTTFQLMGTTQLLSVPYALFAKTAGSGGSIQTLISDADGDTKSETERFPDEDILRFSTFGSERMTINSSGYVGIGVTNPQYPFHLEWNKSSYQPYTDNDIERSKIYLSGTNTIRTDVNGKSVELVNSVNNSDAFNLTAGKFEVSNTFGAVSPSSKGVVGTSSIWYVPDVTSSIGVFGESSVGGVSYCYTSKGTYGTSGSFEDSEVYSGTGVEGYVVAYDNSDLTFGNGVYGRIEVQDAANITSASCLKTDMRINGGTIFNLYGLNIDHPLYSNGTVDNAYGIYINEPTFASRNFSLYSTGGDNYFGGDVGIGTSSPTNKLHLYSSSDPLRLEGLQTNSTDNDVLVSTSSGVVQKRAMSNLVSGNAWSLTGNSGTIPGTTFLGTNDSNDLVIKTNGNERMRVSPAGNIGIGLTNPTSSIDHYAEYTTNGTSENKMVNEHFVVKGVATSSWPQYGRYMLMENQNTPNLPSFTLPLIGNYLELTNPASKPNVSLTGINSFVMNSSGDEGGSLSSSALSIYGWSQANNSSGTIVESLGVAGYSSVTGSGGECTFSTGVQGSVRASSNTSINTQTGVKAEHRITAGNHLRSYGLSSKFFIQDGSVTDVMGLYIDYFSYYGSTFSLENAYGIYIQEPTIGTKNFSIYSNGGKSYFKDNIGIGTTAPTNKLHVNATDPLRLVGLQTNTTDNDVLVSTSTGVIQKRTISNLVSGNAWSLAGNSGTTPGTQFLGTTDSKGLVIKTNGTEWLRVDPSGNIGIGITNPQHKIDIDYSVNFSGSGSNTVENSEVTASGNSNSGPIMNYGKELKIFNSIGGSNGTNMVGGYFQIQNQSNAENCYSVGVKGQINDLSGGTSSELTGVCGDVNNRSDATYSHGTGVLGSILADIPSGNVHNNYGVEGTATVTGMSVVEYNAGISGMTNITGGNVFESATIKAKSIVSGGTVTDLFGIKIDPFDHTGGTVSNAYGIYINGPSAANNNFALYSANGTNYFNENVGIGTIAPTNQLHVNATDPLRLEGLTGSLSPDVLVVDNDGVVHKRNGGFGSDWNLSGNSGTDPSTNYLGTNDLKGLAFRTNGNERMRIGAGGAVGIGTTAPASKLSVGSNSEFQVDGNGNIVMINNVTTSFPASQGSGGSILTNDGSGNLSWNNLAIPTPDGGFAVLMVAGEDMIRGNVVRFSANGKVYKTNPSFPQLVGGVVYQDVTANSPVYIVVSGQAYVLFEVAVPGGAIWAGVSHSGGLNNPGQAYPLSVPPTTTTEHDREVGFPLGTSASPGLVKCMLNFR